MCGSEFAEAMTHHRRRLDAPGAPYGGQRDLHRAGDGLRYARIVQATHLGVLGGELLDERPPEVGPQAGLALVENLAKDRHVQQIGSQGPPPRTLAGEHEGDLGVTAHKGLGHDEARMFLTPDERRQRGGEFRGIAPHHRDPLIMVRATNRRGCAVPRRITMASQRE